MTREKVLLAVVDYHRNPDWRIEDEAAELEELVKACGGEVVETVICRLDRPTASYLIGQGKVDELSGLCEVQGVNTAIFSQDLKGSQQRNLEEALGVKTIDRTQLILDIFARHARSNEGKMQVELAQLEYLLPRLVGKGIELSRLGGGIGTVGPGETKLEVDRRRIAERITRLQKELKAIVIDRATLRKKRKEKGVPLISLVGYTNAGKSTLLNTLTQAEQLTNDGLFTTLESLSRQLTLPNRQQVVLSDTVGFMHDLPHHLIEAFKATLEEVADADLLLHVLDVSHPNHRNLYTAVLGVLQEIGAPNKPMVTVLNKIDKLTDRGMLDELLHILDNPAVLSAKTGENMDALLGKIQEQLSSMLVEVEVMLPIGRMDLINRAHKEGQVYSVKYYNDTIHLRGLLPKKLAGVCYKFAQNSEKLET